MPLSIVIACREPWPAIRRSLDALYAQAIAVGAETIVAANDLASVAPNGKELYPAVRWLNGEPDDSVFRLRARALKQARGEIIALTEEHAWVEPEWCRAILEAHVQFPEVAAIGGVVENGAVRSIPDWAAFFVINGRFMRPIRNGATDEISLQANVAYKRRALPTSFPEFGMVTSVLHHQLRQSGAKLITADQMVVHHLQELTFGEHSAVIFHNARATAAFVRAAIPEWPWLAGYVVLVPTMLWRTLATGISKRRHRRELLLASPLIAWFICCHAAGELLGRLMGPGSSPSQVK